MRVWGKLRVSRLVVDSGPPQSRRVCLDSTEFKIGLGDQGLFSRQAISPLATEGIVLAHPGTSQHFIVEATDANGKVTDVTHSAQILSSNPQVIEINRVKAQMVGVSAGQTEVRVLWSGMTQVIPVVVGNRSHDMEVSFSPDILSILTTKGCNGSGCHGSPAGQNGFKLSLFGYDAEADYQMIVKNHDGRRVNLPNPEESLILQKPSFAIPHGGGQVLPRDSEEYRTILNWLKQGAKRSGGGVHLTRLEMYPTERVLSGKGVQQQAVVIGRLSDGTTRDMTQEVRYATNDDTVATLSAGGVISGVNPGLTTITARAFGQVAAAQIGVAAGAGSPGGTKWVPHNFIDDHVFAKWRELQVEANPLATDEEFVRRVYLDTIGLLPTVPEVHRFLSDHRPGKRARLIDQLLERPEYASYWTVKFEDWFRNCQLHMQGRSMGTFKDWILEWVAADRPYDQVVRELLTSEGDTMIHPAANFWHPASDFMLKKFSVNKVTPTVSRLFLGVRLECAECHNHPLENLTQDDFYGMAAFFSQLRVKHGYAAYRRTWYLEEDGEIENPVKKQPAVMKFLGGDTPHPPTGADRRKVLADWVVSPQNPYFARATVNRIWHEYFETGIVEPFDDFRSTNLPTNPELLDALAGHFIACGYHLKALHRAILNSATYQLASRKTGSTEENTRLDRLLFRRYYPRKLSGEVLLDAIGQLVGVSHPFKGYPAGTSAKDLYFPEIPDYFLVTFGIPRRDVLAERSKNPTLSQALHLQNSEVLTEKVSADNNILGTLIEKQMPDMEIISVLYERAYARLPSEREKTLLSEYLNQEAQSGRARRQALEGVLWSILNSKEFQLNH
ncbi:MAG: DUF1553 domain-containing protein [Terriglobia bacterium]